MAFLICLYCIDKQPFYIVFVMCLYYLVFRVVYYIYKFPNSAKNLQETDTNKQGFLCENKVIF